MEGIGDKPLNEITTDDIRQHLAGCAERVSKVTIDNKRRIYNSFFSWMEDEEHILKNPVKRIRKVRQEKKIPKPFSEEELERLRDAATGERDRAIVELLTSTGMRIGEMELLNINDVDFQAGEIVVFGKGAKERIVYLNAKARVALTKYLDSRSDKNKALFVSKGRKNPSRLMGRGAAMALKALEGKAGVENVHPHRFRRTAATIAISRGMPIEQVREMLGHVNIETTTRYAIVSERNVKASHAKYLN